MEITKKQHYIPQVYLRGFSPDYKCNSKEQLDKEKATIYQYSFEKGEVSKDAVPIKTVCYSDYLYELWDEEGNFAYPNWLETVLGQLEKHFSKYRSRLEKKAFYKENYNVKHFIDSDERCFWLTYMILQIMRLPQVLNATEMEVAKYYNDGELQNLIHNSVRMWCLPFFSDVKAGDKEVEVFDGMYKRFLSMEYCIGVSQNGGLYTSDKPIYIEMENESALHFDESDLHFEQVLFPITSYICLWLLDGKYKNTFENNVLIEIDKKQRGYINERVASGAFDRIYSNHRLTQGEIKRLQKCRAGI